MILWEGPSRIDGQPVVVIATGLGIPGSSPSRNVKTGPSMIQIWILRSDIHPTDAIRSGADLSICGSCFHRGEDPPVESSAIGRRKIRRSRKVRKSVEGNYVVKRKRTCYVRVANAPAAVYRAFRSGVYRQVDWSILSGSLSRIGAYGDPAAVPSWIWHRVADLARSTAGYTHLWKRRPSLRGILMASVDTDEEELDARARGWDVFRVESSVGSRSPDMPKAIHCPADRVARLFADDGSVTCGTCMGKRGPRCTGRDGSVFIPAHGAGTKQFQKAMEVVAR